MDNGIPKLRAWALHRSMEGVGFVGVVAWYQLSEQAMDNFGVKEEGEERARESEWDPGQR